MTTTTASPADFATTHDDARPAGPPPIQYATPVARSFDRRAALMTAASGTAISVGAGILAGGLVLWEGPRYEEVALAVGFGLSLMLLGVTSALSWFIGTLMARRALR